MENKTSISSKPGPSLPRWLLYTICYVAWIALAVVGVWIILQLRLNLIDIAMALNIGPWVLGAVDKFGILLLGLVWIVGVFAAEGYLRQGVERGALWRRMGQVAGIAAIILAASYGLQWLMLYVA